jgi:phage terminase small subunit
MPRGGRRIGAGRPKGIKNGQGRGRQKQSPPGDQPNQEPPRQALKGEIVLTSLAIPPDAMPRDFLLALMRDPELPLAARTHAAALALPFCHPKFGEIGKKAQADIDAQGAEDGGSWAGLLN